MSGFAKWFVSIMVLAAAVLATLAGCSKPGERAGGGKKARVLCSMFPVYLFTRNVTEGSSGVEVELMLPPAKGCPHDYALTPADMVKIAGADVFVANGLGLEEFLGAPLKQANPNIRLIDASKGLTGLIQPTEEAGEHEAGHHHDEGPNPHIFADPRLAAKMAMNIAEELGKVDPNNASLYMSNATKYASELNRLADDCAAATAGLKAKKIVTQHEVFDYLARDAGLEIVAVVEETPEPVITPAHLKDVVAKVKESGAAAVFTEPQYSAQAGKTIADAAGVPCAELDPVASGPDNAPLDYYQQVMRKNIQTLKKTLGEK